LESKLNSIETKMYEQDNCQLCYNRTSNSALNTEIFSNCAKYFDFVNTIETDKTENRVCEWCCRSIRQLSDLETQLNFLQNDIKKLSEQINQEVKHQRQLSKNLTTNVTTNSTLNTEDPPCEENELIVSEEQSLIVSTSNEEETFNITEEDSLSNQQFNKQSKLY